MFTRFDVLNTLYLYIPRVKSTSSPIGSMVIIVLMDDFDPRISEKKEKVPGPGLEPARPERGGGFKPEASDRSAKRAPAFLW